MIKKTLFTLLTLACSSTIVFANPKVEQPKHLGNKIELMFFQHAVTGKIVPEPRNPHCYKLVLNQLNERVIYISDAPARVTGSYTVPQFIETWRHNEKVNHTKPNAILHAKMQNKQWINDTAVFSNLQYDAKKASLTYTLCPLDKSKGFATGKLEAISLFIDPFHPWPP